MTKRAYVLSATAALLVAAACGSSRTGFENDPNGGNPGDGNGGFNADAASGFSRDAACAGSVEPTSRAPGSVLIVLDRSFSMTRNADDMEPRFGDPSKWESAVKALRSLVDGLPNGLNLGMLEYPEPLGCDVPTNPQVPIQDIQVSRGMIKSTLSRGPSGDTPTAPSLSKGFDLLASVQGGGAKAVIFLSDGAPNCGSSESDVQKAVEGATKKGIRTYVVGIPGSPSTTFSKLAVAGGTRRTPTCLEVCDRSWSDAEKCCHYNTTAKDFEQSLTKALDEIAAKIRTSCVYTVPKPKTGSTDPNKVNVVITVEGQETVIARSGDPNDDGWSYTDESGTSLVLHGAICSKVLGAPTSKVEIVVGCATIVK